MESTTRISSVPTTKQHLVQHTLQNYRRQLPNEAFRYLTNTRFIKEKEDRQTIAAKESTQTLGSRGTKKSTIKQRSNTTKVMRPKSYQLYWYSNYSGQKLYATQGKPPVFKELPVNMQTLYAEIGYKISRYAQMCNNSLYKKRNLEKETNLEEAPIGKLDMNKFAPLADLGEDNDKSEKEPIEKFLFQQNKWNNSHVSQSDSYTFTSQMGENRRRKSNHQKANTSAKQVRVTELTELRGLQLQQWKLLALLRAAAQEGIKYSSNRSSKA
ncbi:Hypothetical_protein [Hexamita inflata]|uniref:Hypothetical_protein n=1 Tax=Hexamita inflata TaxID=28002 RepID=A0AA86QP55_9EUKA|nr:Hypothetical protein HINF_LOCUS47967 [Hexamita inflata]